MAELTALVIYDSRLYDRPGQVRRWAERVERRFTINAIQAAPMRSGDLRAGIYGNVDRIGPNRLETVIASTAEHTMFVLKGTTGPIMSDFLWAQGGIEGAIAATPEGEPIRGWMTLAPGNGFGQTFELEVSGQQPQNFFAEAARATARRHSSLRGFSPETVGFTL